MIESLSGANAKRVLVRRLATAVLLAWETKTPPAHLASRRLRSGDISRSSPAATRLGLSLVSNDQIFVDAPVLDLLTVQV